MTTKSININGKGYMFLCEFWGTRHGFAHSAELVETENYKTLGYATRFYLNRTWENYTYQSAMLDAIDSAKRSEYERIENHMKAANGWARMTPKRREEVERGGVFYVEGFGCSDRTYNLVIRETKRLFPELVYLHEMEI